MKRYYKYYELLQIWKILFRQGLKAQLQSTFVYVKIDYTEWLNKVARTLLATT